MRRRDQQAVVLALAASDAMMLAWATAAALAARYGISGWPGGPEATTGGLVFLLLTPALALSLMAIDGLYRLDELFSGHREYAGVVRACTYAAFAALLLSFLADVHVARGALLLTWSCSCLFVVGGRFSFRRAVFRLRRSGLLVRRAIIAGSDEHAIAIARRLADPATGWQVIGFLDDYQPVGAEVVDGLRVVGDPSAALEAARVFAASDIILVPHAVSWEAQRDLLEAAALNDQPAVRLAPGLYHLLATGARPLDANYVPLFSLERLRITGLDAALKTAMDYALSLAALPALAAALCPLWLASRICQNGALLARQEALGLRGVTFQLLTLAPPGGSEPPSGPRRWAWRLRAAAAKSRLGKLPTVVNVLAGRMSLIGPRALCASDGMLERPWARTLLLVRPGLTGPHPANGHWSAEEQAILDVAYVRDYSLWIDLRLLVASVRRALRRERPLPAAYHPALASEALPVEETAR